MNRLIRSVPKGMRNYKYYFSFVLIVANCFSIQAQENVTTFGFTVKPIFSSKYFRTGAKNFDNNNVSFTIEQRSGFSAGAVIRKGLTKTFSLETGISYTKRLYGLSITDSNYSDKSDFKIIGYQIPIQALVFIRLSRTVWMNAALGPALEIFPSDVQSFNDRFLHEAVRNNRPGVFNAGLNANIGWEWRTAKSGYIYIGSSYHRSFTDLYESSVAYWRQPDKPTPYALGKQALAGDYFTIDLRYYFHENPERKKPKKK